MKSQYKLKIFYLPQEGFPEWLKNFLDSLQNIYNLDMQGFKGDLESLIQSSGNQQPEGNQTPNLGNSPGIIFYHYHLDNQPKDEALLRVLQILSKDWRSFKVFILYKTFDSQLAAKLWFVCQNVIGYEPSTEKEALKGYIKRVIAKELEKFPSEKEGEKRISVGDLFPLGEGDYSQQRFTSLFVGGTGELLLEVRRILHTIYDFMGKVCYPSLKSHPFFKNENRTPKKIFDEICNGELPQDLNLEDLRRKLEKAFPLPSILILGETGTGKTLLAELIHRQTYPDEVDIEKVMKLFQDLNCSAIPQGMLDGELFGFKEGAFTGAVDNHPGKLFHALYGTLFLDEIGDMPTESQTKLLKFLDFGGYNPLYVYTKIYIPCVIIAATNKPIEQLLESGQFRRDLYERFSYKIYVPSLRERIEHLDRLVDFVLQDPAINPTANRNQRWVGGISESALAHLKNYEFPGNFRELRAILWRAVRLAHEEGKEVILPHHIIFPSRKRKHLL